MTKPNLKKNAYADHKLTENVSKFIYQETTITKENVHNKYKVIIKVFLITIRFRNMITGKYFVRMEVGELVKYHIQRQLKC